ncbi:TonB-dependent receptor [Desulfolithobacter dissulfuricans]|uniref:TonB-dependent receptor n=1 Tax=Desulfolithobacter dissulfuricans TaxID=2795293 RepID=A0A915U2X9_9BACT|nr:TonB-dependent receptor [Desulfolithobacter dissulfuricans]BCO10366.1 TonB-dependent receptor [Desulfolithobacter dissulfuricans]
MKKEIRAALALCLVATPGLALAGADEDSPANEVTLDEVVVTATRSEESVREIPAKVEVIDGETIELTTGDTLTEQLKKNSSIGVIEYPGALAGIGIRGFRPEFSGITKHTLVLVNGRPAGATNLATLLTDNVERIEVLKGPASSLYGGEAMGGVVNVITKKHTGPLTGMAEIGFGSFETNAEKTAVGGSMGRGFDFDIFANRFEQADDYKMGDGATRPNTAYKIQNGSLRLGGDLGAWRIDVRGDIYQGRDIETPGDIAYGNDMSGHKDIDRFGMDVTLGGPLGDSTRISFTGYRSNETAENYNHYSGWYPSVVQVTPYRSYDSETDWLGFQLKDEYTWGSHRFVAGIDYQDIDRESRSYNQDGTRRAPWSPDEGRENWAGYLETIWRFMDDRLTATIGGRYDTFEVETKPTPYKTDFTPNSEDFSTFSPRAGLNYNLDLGLRLHTTIGKAFVPPTAAQLAGYAETDVGGVTMVTRGNPDLNPESSITWDIGIGYAQPRLGLSMDVTYFHTDVDDKITTITVGNTTTYENSLSAEMEGLETEFSFDIGAPMNWDRSLELFVNATHMFKAEEEQPDGTMSDIHNVADYTINYGLRYSDDMFDARLHFRSQGRMKDTDWTAPGYPEIEYPSFTVADLVVGMSFKEHHRLTLKVDNLFDEYYYEKTGYPKPGRGLYLSYRYAF